MEESLDPAPAQIIQLSAPNLDYLYRSLGWPARPVSGDWTARLEGEQRGRDSA